MIVVDPLFDTTHVDNRKWPYAHACHMMSDQAGKAGEDELIEFARRLRINSRRIQREGTPHVHFDLTPARRIAAVKKGALEVSATQMAVLTKAKMVAS